MKLECEVCARSKWKSACPECDGTGEIVVSEKIKYWWSEDRKFFCILANDGTSQATVSLTVEEVEEMLGEAQQTPGFLKLQEEAWQRAQQLMDKRASAGETKCP
jgi:DNA-binding transcriptional regulator YbjK